MLFYETGNLGNCSNVARVLDILGLRPLALMMSPPAPQVNAKRYWGEEKNIDSIYSIYLKKISYTYNNDISLSSTYASPQTRGENRTSLDDANSSTSTSSNDLAKLAISNTNQGKHFVINSNCQKPVESPRGRKNFFQKYRRRSCSMDKYSFEKQQHKNSTSSNKSKNMHFATPNKKASNINEDMSISHDNLDGLTNNSVGYEQNYQKHQAAELQKSMNELSNQSSQSLQWETRQIRVLQAATLDHALKFILLINSTRDLRNIDRDSDSAIDTSALEEERNNVAHIIHVMFCTYRIYTNPYELMLKIMDYSDLCRVEQYRFVMHYWMDNYPEDFDYIVDVPENSSQQEFTSVNNPSVPSMASYNDSMASYDSLTTTKTAGTSDSENSTGPTGGSQSGSDNLDRRLSNLSIKTTDEKSGIPLVNELLRLCRDDYIRNKAIKLHELKCNGTIESDSTRRTRHHYQAGSKNSTVLDLDSRYVAQQLTAIDLENFLSLRPYSLLEGTKSDKRIQSMIKNFNLLSRHVVVTILKSHNPHIVASHWIAIAMNLRKTKNFNSLKAIIAGLTNESIYRLKQVIWSKIDRASMTNFKLMASIVDDVNNQTVLRQTQLIVEGTAKMSIEDDSFGTIPYLGTFLTDLNMIDARYQTYVPSPKDETSKLKLINFEKCAKQFEILTQVQLLQKNVLASLHAIQRRNHFDEQTTLNRLKLEFNQSHQMHLAKPAIPQVSKLFEHWFYDKEVAIMTDKQW